MADPLFAVARKQVYYRNFNHCIATRLLTHSGTRHTYQHLCREGRIVDSVIVLWVISAVLSGAAIVSGQFQRPSLLSGVTQRTPCAG